MDEIRNIRKKLKSSKSYPNQFINQQQKTSSPNTKQIHLELNNEEGDNSSSGVSSDQEITMNATMNASHNETQPVIQPILSQPHFHPIQNKFIIQQQHNQLPHHQIQHQQIPHLQSLNHQIPHQIQPVKKIPSPIDLTKKTIIHNPDEPIIDDDDDRSPSPPLMGFQRHNSMTRKQASSIAISRGVIPARPAVSLVQLPPPIENDSEGDSPPLSADGKKAIEITPTNEQSSDFIVLAPPPQFCDQVDGISRGNGVLSNNSTIIQPLTSNTTTPHRGGVRIVGAVPKSSCINNRLHTQ